MHTSTIDLGPLLSQLGLVPRGTAIVTPTINHSHIIDQQLHTDAIWWQVVSVLITDPNEWPTADGKKGITSLKKLRQAQALGKASADVPTNFFLFFGSDVKGTVTKLGDEERRERIGVAPSLFIFLERSTPQTSSGFMLDPELKRD